MSADATVEGSIKGVLTLDYSDWMRKIEEAEAKARELGRISPDVRVSAETADAIAQLEAVQAAAAAAGGDHVSRVTTVTSTVGGSSGLAGRAAETDALTVAIGRLDAAMAALDADQAADAASQAAATEEMRQGSVQALKESLNMEALAAAERNAAAGAKEKALADIAAANATDKASAANGTNVSRMGLIIGAVAALIPLLGPLAGYAVGVSGALAGMGAAGVLAVLGIKNAMADGNAMGQTYAAGLQVLKGDLDQLEQTAASGILSGFQSAISTINDAMPSLNGEIGLFSTQLGTVGNLVLQGVVSAFRTLNPLFLTAGTYVEQIAAGFQAWTSDGGLQKFVTMAMQYFPQVVDTVGQLLQGIMSLIDGLAPLGGAMLTVLGAAGQLIEVVGGLVGLLSTGLGPAFGPIVVGAGAAFAAFKLWGVLAPLISGVSAAVYAATDSVAALGVAIDVTEGPVGWIIAAMAAVGAAFAIAASSTSDAAKATDTYAAAVQQDNGVIGENVTKQAASNLQKDGAFAAAQKLGISTLTLTQATLNEGSAHDKLVSKLNATIKAHTTLVDTGSAMVNVQDAQAKSAQKVLDSMTAEHGGIKAQIKAYNDIATAVGGTSIKTKDQLQAQKDLAAEYGLTVPALEAAQAATAQNGAAAVIAAGDIGTTVGTYNDLVTAVAGATQASKNWKAEQDIINGVAQSVEQANITLSQAYTTMATTIASNIKSVGVATATSMDINTQYGAQNHQMILNEVTDAEAAAAAQVAADLKAGKSHAQAAADGAAILAAQKQKILDQATAAGLSRDAVQKLLDQIDLLKPKDVPISVETAAANAKIAEVKANLDALNGKSVTAQINTFQKVFTLPTAPAPVIPMAPGHSQGGTIYKAMGGMVDAAYLAAGGNTSMFQPRGTDTVPAMLTPGEEVTSDAHGQASTWRPLLKLINAGAPGPAIAALATRMGGSGASRASVTQVAQAKAPIQLTVLLQSKGGIDLTQYIKAEVQAESNGKRVQLSTGLQQVAF